MSSMTEIGVITESTVRQTHLFLAHMREAFASSASPPASTNLARLEKLNDELTDILFFFSRDQTTPLSKRSP